jgi:hypothetical protein
MAGGVSLRRCLGACCVAAAVTVCVEILAQSYEPELQYKQRGSHYEGLRAIPISGSVQLLSARVIVDDRQGPATSASALAWGDRARLRFYLPKRDSVTVTVRQLRSGSTYYVLDRVEATWNTGTVNEYAWPTKPVLGQLTNVRPTDLGAVVNLGSGKDTNRETVLPVVLFDDALDGRATSYRFSFKTDGRARVDAAIFAGARELFRRPTNWEAPGSPFTVLWAAGTSPEGWYRLLLKGQFDDGTTLDKEVTFYHRPALSGAGGPPR